MSTPCLLILLFFHLLDPQLLLPALSLFSLVHQLKSSQRFLVEVGKASPPCIYLLVTVLTLLRAFCRGSLSSQCPLGHSSGLWSKASSLANCCFTWHISLNYLHNYLSLLEGTVRNGIKNYFSLTLSL